MGQTKQANDHITSDGASHSLSHSHTNKTTLDTIAISETTFGAHSIGQTLNNMTNQSGAVSLDMRISNQIEITTNGNITSWVITAPTYPGGFTITLNLGAHTVAWTGWTNLSWQGGTTPTFTASKTHVIGIRFNGTKYRADVSLDYTT